MPLTRTDEKITRAPWEWRQPLADVLDTAEIVATWCKENDVPLTLIADLTRLVVERRYSEDDSEDDDSEDDGEP